MAQEDIETNGKELISSFSFICPHSSPASYFTDNFCRPCIELVHFLKILTMQFCDQTTPINNLSVLLATFSMIYSQSQSAIGRENARTATARLKSHDYCF